jgi:hypothetical protein
VRSVEAGVTSRLLLVPFLCACTGAPVDTGKGAGADSGPGDTTADDTAAPAAVDDYRDAMARAYCETVYGCEGYGEEFFPSVEECITAWESLIALDDCATRCAFDADAGTRCIADLVAYTCEDVESGSGAPASCFDVFDCGSSEPQNCLEGLCPLGE